MNLSAALGVLAALQLAAGLLIQLSVLRLLGAGTQTDAFIAAQTLPLVMYAVLAASLQNVWLPRLSSHTVADRSWLETQRAAQGQVMLLFGAALIVLVPTATGWQGWLFPGFDATQLALVGDMTVPLLLAAQLNCHSALYTAAMRTRERFLLPEAVSLAASLLAFLAIVALVPRSGIVVVAWVMVARAVCVLLVLFLISGRQWPSLPLAYRDATAWRQLRPLLGASSLYKTGPLVDRYWSSQAVAGGMTLFGLAQTGIGALTTILERAFCMPLNARMGRLVAGGDYAGLRRGYRRSLRQITLITFAVGVLLLAVKPVWSTLIGTLLRLDAESAGELWWYVTLLLGHLHVGASGTVCVAAFYAMGDTKTPSLVLMAGFALGVVLKSIGFLSLDLRGLALAASIYHLVNLVWLMTLLEARLRPRACGQ